MCYILLINNSIKLRYHQEYVLLLKREIYVISLIVFFPFIM